MLKDWKLSKKTFLNVAKAAALLTTAYVSQNFVNSDQFGLRESFGVVSNEVLPPGLYITVPYFSYTHSYQSKVQQIVLGAGSSRFLPTTPSSADQNVLVSDIVLNYRTEPNPSKLGLHRWEMDGWIMPDGYWLITGLLNDSANSVLGRREMHATLSDPKRFLNELAEDFSFRLNQNNVPVIIESIELKGFHTTVFPTRSKTYQQVGLDQNQPGVNYTAPQHQL